MWSLTFRFFSPSISSMIKEFETCWARRTLPVGCGVKRWKEGCACISTPDWLQSQEDWAMTHNLEDEILWKEKNEKMKWTLKKAEAQSVDILPFICWYPCP